MNFTFVTHHGARPERSGLVKSHVMRESQRRRKEARQSQRKRVLGSEAPNDYMETVISASQPMKIRQTKSPSRVNHTQTRKSLAGVESLNLDRMEKIEEQGGCMFTDAETPAEVMAPFPDASTNPLAPGTQRFPFVGQLPCITSSSGDGGAIKESETGNDAGMRRRQASAEKSPSAVLNLEFPSLLLELPAGAECVAQPMLARMSDLVSHYCAILDVEVPKGAPANPGSYWLRAAQSNIKIPTVCSLFYCAHRDTTNNTVGSDHDYFRYRSLNLINSALQDPVKAVAEDNIFAVISVSMYENVRGSDFVMHHLAGLRRMIDLQGGINNLPSGRGQRLMEMALIQDMLQACFSNTAPTMFDISGPAPREIQRRYSYLYPQSPLRTVNDSDFGGIPGALKSSTDVLNDAFANFEILCIGDSEPALAAEEADAFRIRRELSLKRLMARNETKDAIWTSYEDKAEEAIHLTAQIHFRACALGVLHDDEMNADDMIKIHDIIRTVHFRFWKVAHYVYVWILLTAGAASRNHPRQRPYFVSELMRMGYGIGLFDWRSFRQIMGNFLWLQQCLRRWKLKRENQQ